MNCKIIKALIVTIAFSCGIAIHTTPGNNRLLALAESITKAKHRSSRKHARESLLADLKHNHKLTVPTLAYAFTAFHFKKDTLLFREHSALIYEAIERFTRTPGFISKLHTLLVYADRPSFLKGHVYEVETALARSRRGEIVRKFSHSFYCNTSQSMRAIDLITNAHFIECKNIDWRLYRNDTAEKIQSQLLSYKAFEQDEDDQEGRTLLLVSKQPITQSWKRWLDDNSIAYQEENN